MPPQPHPKYIRAKRKKQLRRLFVIVSLVAACLALLVLSLWLMNPASHPAEAPRAPSSEDAPVKF